MTKKDFILIAKAIANTQGIGKNEKLLVALTFSDAFAGTNPSFKREVFLAACGVDC